MINYCSPNCLLSFPEHSNLCSLPLVIPETKPQPVHVFRQISNGLIMIAAQPETVHFSHFGFPHAACYVQNTETAATVVLASSFHCWHTELPSPPERFWRWRLTKNQVWWTTFKSSGAKCCWRWVKFVEWQKVHFAEFRQLPVACKNLWIICAKWNSDVLRIRSLRKSWGVLFCQKQSVHGAQPRLWNIACASTGRPLL